MAVVHSIDVAVTATTSQFEEGMKRAAASMSDFDASQKKVMASMDKAFDLFKKGAITQDEYSRRIAAGEADLAALAGGFNRMSDATQRASDVLKDMETSTDRYNAKLAELDGLLKLGALSAGDHAKAVAHAGEVYSRSIPTAEWISESDWRASSAGFENMSDAAQKASGIIQGLQTPLDNYNDKINLLDRLMKAGSLSAHQHAAAVRQAGEAYRSAAPAKPAGLFASAIDSMVTKVIAGVAAFKAFDIAIQTTGRIIGAVANKFSEIDAASKVAQGLGMAVGEFRKLQFAVQEVAGADVTAPLQNMGKAIAEATMTGGKSAEVFDKIGLSLQTLRAMSPEQAFYAIVDAISQYESAGDRAALADQIFGRSHKELLPIFEQGGAALRESAAAAQALGLNISDVDASAMSAARDAVERLSVAMQQVAEVIAGQMATRIEALAVTVQKRMQDSTSEMSKFATAITFVVDAVAILVTNIDELVTQLSRIVLPESISKLIQLYFDLQGASETASGATQSFWDQYTANLDKAKQKADDLAKSMAGARSGIASAFETPEPKAEPPKPPKMDAPDFDAKDWTDAVESVEPWDLDEATKKAIEAAEEWAKKGEEVAKRFESPIDKFKREVGELQNLEARGLIDPDVLDRAMASATEDAMQALEAERGKPEAAMSGAAALERGTQAAFSQFQKNMRNDKQGEEQTRLQKEMRDSLAKLARSGLYLRPASGI